MTLEEDPNYGFALGRVRSLEKDLLGSSEYDLLVRTADASEFTAAVAETSYARHFSQGRASGGVESALARAVQENDDFFAKYCLDPWLLDFVRLRTDALNLKLLAKQKLARTEPEPGSLVKVGTLGQDALRRITAGSGGAAHPWAEAAWAAATDLQGTLPDPSAVDAIIDRALQSEQIRVVCKSRFLLGYLELYADTENIRTMLRARVLGEGRELLQLAYLAGGATTKQELAALLEREWSEVAAHFSAGPLRDYVAAGIAGLERSRSLLAMEKVGRELKLAYLRRSKYSVFGHEPLVAFYLLRENELTNIRQLWSAKVAGLPEDKTRELVAYVS